MLKRKAIRKIFITTITIIILLMIYMIPSNDSNSINKLNVKEKIEYSDVITTNIYLLNDNDLLVKVNTIIDNNDSLIEKVKNVLNSLLQKDTIPNGLRNLIPKNLKVLEVKMEEQIVYINFSKELLNIEEKYEEKLIESIVYSLFEIKEINGISIYIENETISDHYKGVPSIIKRDFGINKKYDLTSFKDVEKIITYYVTKINNNNYYVPVTNYVNTKEDKIKIIVENLSSNYIYESNLMSFLSNKTELINFNISDDTVTLNFNNDIFISDGKILEEVIYTLGYSIIDNYDVKKVIFNVEDNLIHIFEK